MEGVISNPAVLKPICLRKILLVFIIDILQMANKLRTDPGSLPLYLRLIIGLLNVEILIIN
jgi:hypothetical protein